MSTLPYICPNTTIRQLMQAGIVPAWMYEDLAKTPCTIKGKLDYLFPAIKEKLNQYRQNNPASAPSTPISTLLSPQSPLWVEIQEKEPFGFKPDLLSRALAYFLK